MLTTRAHELLSGDYKLAFRQSDDNSYGVAVSSINADKEAKCFIQEQPLSLLLKVETDKNDKSKVFRSGYSSVEKVGSGIICSGSINTENGSILDFEDTFSVYDDTGSFKLSRKATVVLADDRDLGFSTEFGLHSPVIEDMYDYDFFAPGVWYAQNANVARRAIARDYSKDYFYIRETRLALPVIMMRNIESGETISFCHTSPSPSSDVDESTADWLVDESLQYASLGIHKSPHITISIAFPGSEGETNYIRRRVPWARRSHPVDEKIEHRYQIIIRAANESDFPRAMRNTWRASFDIFSPEVIYCDIPAVYEAGIELLYAYCKKYNNNAMGLPWTINIPDGTIDAITYQMGFVGQQIPAGYQLIRYGFENDQIDYVKKGEEIVDFWAENAITECGLPMVWYDVMIPRFRDYPTYIRIASDGMEGMLNAWEIMESHGIPKAEWLDSCIAYGNWLVKSQNEDGSFYRAYDWEGVPVHKGKFNSTNPVRYLTRLFNVTRDKQYLQTAIRAGNFAYEHIHRKFMYVGGTPDNPNTIDKEAGILAMYAFMSIYDATGEQKWLDATARAADFTETWVYSWEFPVKSDGPQNVFENRGISGQSLIATGHSGADVFMAYGPFYYYRLYLFTDDIHYLDFARFLLRNTKQTTDWSGELGYKYRGLVQEVFNVTSMSYRGLGKWLPWCTIAEIEPLANLKDVFGSMEIDEIEGLPLQERKARNMALSHTEPQE